MNATLKNWKTSRNLLLNLLEQTSIEKLNTIPAGFNNNIIWNIGHIIVAQQGLVYKSSGLTDYISDDLFNRYKPGTKPESFTSEDEANELKSLLIELTVLTEKDLEKGIFKTYKERRTATGFHLANVQDALEFNNFHEGLHIGYILSIRKFL
ncbi:DinB family protein [Algoriphagus lutimaris]|uniref:DinB family protein n=1 Tax=Algoriphagus lutimaris TaxID=613197 RepID=UPI00196B8F00|nr:DinB family protein [Algoriphagus lutimaris]MBN3521645.1 DinB family protein [Algoriphagus lutimaris]